VGPIQLVVFDLAGTTVDDGGGSVFTLRVPALDASDPGDV